MALTWDVTNVTNSEEITEGNEWGITETTIWMTMMLGLSGITEANVDEFVARSALCQAIDGPLLSMNGKSVYVTEEMIRRRVGLRTNVTEEKRAAWLKRQTEDRSTIKRIVRKQSEANEEVIASLLGPTERSLGYA